MVHSLFTPWELRTDGKLAIALVMALRGLLAIGMHATRHRYQDPDTKWAYYLSIEYLPGRMLQNNVVNLDIMDMCAEVLEEAGSSLDNIWNWGHDLSLGNGGLGRLASCFLDSMATQGLPAVGYGLRYHFGLFRQGIVDGQQKEYPDEWMLPLTPGQMARYDELYEVKFNGHIEGSFHDGSYTPRWVGYETVLGVPYDLPSVGYGGHTVNIFRLFDARASVAFEMDIFNQGDYIEAVRNKLQSEMVSKILYPREDVSFGRVLRLFQEYFLVSCSLQDILRRFRSTGRPLVELGSQAAVQMNDTHPALAVPELMRLLMDQEGLGWDEAWAVTTKVLAYTNHTLMPEALEVWPVDMLEQHLPRHLQIIFEINRRHLDEVAAAFPGDTGKLCAMSVVEEHGGKKVRMGHLAVVGSHAVNGVSCLHSELVRTRLFPDFATLWPERFQNKTNGVTPRLWLRQANPGLSSLLDEVVGPSWVTDLDRARGLESVADDTAFHSRFNAVKRANKEALIASSPEMQAAGVIPDSIFDVQAKRIHEYKRQLLNCLHILHLYLGIVEDGVLPAVPKTYLFAGKAAPGYFEAKGIIQLIVRLGDIINNDVRTKGMLKVVFLPDYKVSLAERLIPAADVSEQISTAGTEASGTGNMKFAMNGALTIGTYDGANIEMVQEIGSENLYIFGMRAEAVEALLGMGYDPGWFFESDERIRRVMEALRDNVLSREDPGLFQWIWDKLMAHGEQYCHLADFGSYADTHARLAADWLDERARTRKGILSVARMGKFSSDRAIREYAKDIWGVKPILE